MRRQHPVPQFDLPIPPSRLEHLAIGMSGPGTVDVSVCEWTADLSVRTHLDFAPACTTLSGVGFVDFDAMDSIHETTASVGHVRP